MQLHLASQMVQNRVNGENEIKAEVMDELDESEEKSISSKDDSEKGLYIRSQQLLIMRSFINNES